MPSDDQFLQSIKGRIRWIEAKSEGRRTLLNLVRASSKASMEAGSSSLVSVDEATRSLKPRYRRLSFQLRSRLESTS